MRSRSTFAVALLFSGVALAQTGAATWQGLRFGISLSDAKQALKTFEFQTAAAKDSYSLTPDYEVKVGKSRILFTPLLTFDSDGLRSIALSADIPKIMADNPGFPASTLAAVFERAVYEQLEAKYGRSIDAKGQCGDVPIDMLIPSSQAIPSCNASWRGDGQSISFFWVYNNRQPNKFTLLITYRAISSSL